MSQVSGPQSSEGSNSGLGEAQSSEGSNSGLVEAQSSEGSNSGLVVEAQSSDGSNSGLLETSPDFSGACFSWDDDEISPYNGILNLQAPDFTTIMAIVHGEGHWTEVAWCFQDPEFMTLLNFMNNLGPESIEDEDVLDFATLVSSTYSHEEADEEDPPYDVIKVLLNVDDVSEELKKNGEQAEGDQA